MLLLPSRALSRPQDIPGSNHRFWEPNGGLPSNGVGSTFSGAFAGDLAEFIHGVRALDTKGRTFSGRGRTAVLPPWAVLRQIVNHSTYHRGQIATMIRQVGGVPMGTDLLNFAG